ncbi:MAG: hypothetical protein KAI02_05460 [Gammaproteobacteria bacterium]|nr:hypothetical protein [Gammaproteobacteria bacterium]
MKIILFLVVSGISNGSDNTFNYQMEKHYTNIEECVQTSIIMRKILQAEDNLQVRETTIYTHCEVNKDGLSEQEYAQAHNKIRRLEKFYTMTKW